MFVRRLEGYATLKSSPALTPETKLEMQWQQLVPLASHMEEEEAMPVHPLSMKSLENVIILQQIKDGMTKDTLDMDILSVMTTHIKDILHYATALAVGEQSIVVVV